MIKLPKGTRMMQEDCTVCLIFKDQDKATEFFLAIVRLDCMEDGTILMVNESETERKPN